jgi:uncharacterized protein YfaS (alpha-2-macroglobulin family)
MKKFKLLCLPLLVVVLFACGGGKSKKVTMEYSEEISRIINSAPNGYIDNNDRIEIGFTKNMVDDIDDAQIAEGILTFKPSIKGKAYWYDKQTIRFEPEELLPFHEVYTGTLKLDELSEDLAEQGYSNFKFNFQVNGREISQFTGELQLKDRFDPKELVYKGAVQFTESTTVEKLQDVVKLKEGSKSYEIFWTKTDGKSYTFESETIIREDDTKNFKLTIEKDDLDLSDDFVREFQITPIAEMKIVRATQEEDSKYPKLRVEFSDAFDSEQNLNGLIKVKPKVKFKLKKLGNSIILDGDFEFGTEYKVIVAKGVRSKWGTVTNKETEKTVKFSDLEPQVEFASDGVFLPSDNKYRLQFYSSNLSKVHIEVKKVYDNSIFEFINTERLSSSTNRHTPFDRAYINRVGVIVHNQTFDIGKKKNRWLLSEVDLTGIVKNYDEGLYLVRINFNPGDMLVDPGYKTRFKHIEHFGQIYKPIFFSNIGLTCKKTDGKYLVFATDLSTCKPMQGVKLKLKRSYSNKTIRSAKTNTEGMAELDSDGYYYSTYIEAKKDGMRSIIKFNEMKWNISGFDVGGVDSYDANTRAFIYTERGVYRPGDNINLSVIARHQDKIYSDNTPLTVKLYNPQGKKVYEQISKSNNDGFYNFRFQTRDNDPTGNWDARFSIGNRYFSHTVKIETVVPYKLKVKIKPKTKRLTTKDKTFSFDINCNYLFGNPASNLNAEVDIEIQKVNKRFAKYSEYIFANPEKDFRSITENVYNAELNSDGKATINWDCPNWKGVPSALNMKVTAKVLEKSGRPNINWVNIPIEPYSHYVGIQSPKYSYVATGNDMDIPVILLNDKGVPVAGKTIKYRIYRNSTYWWWQYDSNKKLRFKTDYSTVLVKEGMLTSKRTPVIVNFLPVEEGAYFVEVTDESGTKHSSGVKLNAYPYGASPSGDKNAGSLALVSDKEKYNVGEVAKVQFPSPKEGVILLTIEKQNEILSKKVYYPEKEGEMTIEIPVDKSMVPNAYVSVSLIQPQNQTVNDRPIRMFGMLPLNVEDKNTRHEIEIKTPIQFRPKEPFEVEIQTKDRKKTQFTIAVVDEGLLDITQFRTPNPWKYFFKKLRLDVETFDLFSHVISANKGDVFKTFSIGGDMDYRESQMGAKKGKKRFKPVSMFKGPMYTDENGNAKVKFNMPNYVGSVRVMVIGARDNSYARADKAVPVKTELMVLPGLPRVIGPGEKFRVPVSVFALKDGMGNVNVDISVTGPLKVVGGKQQVVKLPKASDKDCYFMLQADNAAGQSSVTITATAGKYKAEHKVDLMVRPSSARIYDSKKSKFDAGTRQTMNIPKIGIDGTNRAVLNVSPFPIVNFGHRLRWLIHYPYGCIEQTTSSVFPQLHLKKFIKYPEAFSAEIDDNINAALTRLRKFQTTSGGFSYWPYGSEASQWGTLYGGHFMVEAKKMGYHVDEDLYENWLRYVSRQARNNNGKLRERVYRTYILALASDPQHSEMNLIRESNLHDLDDTGKWLLAASFYLSGKQDVANDIAMSAGFNTREYKEFSGTYGSGLRDKAMILDALVQMQRYTKADEMLEIVSKYIGSQNWYSTQTIGYSLLAIGKYMGVIQGNNPELKVVGELVLADGERITINQAKTFTYSFTKDFGKDVTLITDASGSAKKIYTTLSWNGVPLVDKSVNESKNLTLEVDWYDEEGYKIDPSVLKQGTTFWGHFRVRNISSVENIDENALVQVLPSGWEIENTRLLESSRPDWASDFNLNREEYLDIRDDRIMWFFDIHYFSEKSYDFVVKLNAVTVGEYNLPSTIVEAMYDSNYKAVVKGKKVKVVKND